jgi:hypothetical protein
VIDYTSRYANIDVGTVTIPDGTGGTRTVRYLRRRFLPPADTSPTLTQHQVTGGERIDLVTASYLGDPTQYWRVCDANTVIHPDTLTNAEQIGAAVRIPLPQA